MPITKILKKNILENFKKNDLINYVETGVHEGFSIYQSIEIGFQNIFGIEKNLDYVKNVKNRFKKNTSVHIMNADSRNGLEEVFKKKINNTFVYLDAHGHLEIDDSPVEEEMIFLKKKNELIKLLIVDDFYQIKKKSGDWQKNTNLNNLLKLSENFFDNHNTFVKEIFYYYGGWFKRKKNSYLVISRDIKFKNYNFFYRLMNEIYIFLLHKIKSIINVSRP
jgi:hypothetical protein